MTMAVELDVKLQLRPCQLNPVISHINMDMIFSST